MSHTLWRSERLLYRAAETDDDPFLYTLDSDPDTFLNASPYMPLPRSKKIIKEFREFLTDKSLLGCIICIPSVEAPDDDAKATPIGILHLTGGDQPHFLQHRQSEIGLMLLRPYQGQGYGSEAIRWALRWGFRRANLHRIGIGAISANAGALRLYERLGFLPEARRRDFWWHDGKYYDVVELAMLEDEWRAKYDSDDSGIATGK